MTAQHPDILTVRDAEILRLLQRLVAIGEYRRQFTADHVAHVVNRWLVPRNGDVRYLRAVPPPPDDDTPTVTLPKGQAAAIRTLAANPGANNYDIGVLLGIGTDAAKDRLRRAYTVLGVHNRTEAVQLITSGQVRIIDKPRYQRGRS
jgi:hypothetical protein